VLLALVVGFLLGVLLMVLRLGRRPAVEDPAVVAARHENALLRQRGELDQHRSGIERELAAARTQVLGLTERLADAEEQVHEAQQRRERDVVDQRRRDEQESRVLQALAPVREQLGAMQGKVTELEQQRSVQHGELSAQLRSALESEERLRGTAETLASALRSNSTRGVWGETQLRSVVEAAGLLERVDFDVQHGVVTDGGAGRPDMVVHLPGGKRIAVDAKVPFNAYLEAVAIPATASDAERARRDGLMKAHVKAVRDHVTTLGGKTYWEGLGASPELVIAFIPSESLISTALETDPGLLEFAFSKRVALASPVTLWSVLKTVAFSWQQDVVTDEARQLFEASRELHGRLARMAEHVEKLGRSIERSVKDYNLFVGSLERQVLPSARKLTRLDPSKSLATPALLEEQRRELTAYDLLAELEEAAPRHRDDDDLPELEATPRAS